MEPTSAPAVAAALPRPAAQGDVAPASPLSARAPRVDFLANTFAILFGVIITMTVCGYEFAHGDHTVYLVEPLHLAFPNLLANDWFTTQTLQYHSAFSFVTAMLMRLGIAGKAFLLGYLGLVLCLHIAWFQIVRAIGGSRVAYLLSVILHFMSRGGVVLASYAMLQDSELVASNIASVTMLIGIALWLRRRPALAGLALGVSGMFHLNYAVGAIGGWFVLVAMSLASRGLPRPSPRGLIVGTILLIAAVVPNVMHAIPAVLHERHASLSLDDFVQLYVRIRHPHHYDPTRWHPLEWLAFTWQIPLALVAFRLWRRRRGRDGVDVDYARRESMRVYAGFCAALMIAFVGAGIWYVSVTLIQLSLYRFGVFVHMLGCVAAAYLICDAASSLTLLPRLAVLLTFAGIFSVITAAVIVDAFHNHDPYNALAAFRRFVTPALVAFACMSFAPAVLLWIQARSARWQRGVYLLGCIAMLAVLGARRGTWRGMVYASDCTAEQLAFCEWIRDPQHTPVDAIFLVSPSDQIFRLHAQRAIVVNFKSPPQLSSELPEWHNRLRDSVNLADLFGLAGFRGDIDWKLNQLYERVPDDTRYATARKYGASFVLVRHRMPPRYDSHLIYHLKNGSYFLYHVPP
jgi:hypothetical protein